MYLKFLTFGFMLQEKAGEGTGGGSGTGKGAGTGAGTGTGTGTGAGEGGDWKTEMASLKADLAKLTEALTKKSGTSVEGNETPETKDLRDKAQKEREQKEKGSQDAKAVETALRFSIQAPEWLKTNANLLPKTINDIFETANKEKFDTEIEKVSAIKSGILQEFFSVQANLDLLTAGQKTKVEDYLKLTKLGKQEKAITLYEDIFEPAFATLKLVKKAEQLKNGGAEVSDVDQAYKERLHKQANKHYLGVEK